MNEAEPAPVTMTNPDGIKIPFGSADVKALLDYYYAFYTEGDTHQLGNRCSVPVWMGGGNCSDVNAGAFHIVVANQIGLLGVATGNDVQLDDVGAEKFSAINLEDFPGGISDMLAGQFPGLTVRRAFRYSDTQATAVLKASAVEPDVRGSKATLRRGSVSGPKTGSAGASARSGRSMNPELLALTRRTAS